MYCILLIYLELHYTSYSNIYLVGICESTGGQKSKGDPNFLLYFAYLSSRKFGTSNYVCECVCVCVCLFKTSL